jgi:energy-coupling factor transporter transmembrane protein EcfT
MRRVVLSADQLALAMLARGYQETRTDPDLCATLTDGMMLAGAAALLGLVLVV